ncbi:MAG: thioredoxin family protein [Flavipsychrobacter sp.]|nr:thioredoxin family protein [Flavipsychrobacter sp.]
MRMMLGLAVAAMIAAPAHTFAQGKESIAIGTSLPAASEKMKSVDGKNITLSGANKEGLVVMFSCNTCPYVVKSQARTKEVMNYAKEKGVGMVIINSNEAKRGDDDSYDAMKKYAKAQGYDVPYVVDEKSKVADAFGANRTPEVFLFDKSGKLVYKGAMEDNPSSPSESRELYLRDAIDQMLAGKPVHTNTTKSVGCTIKRLP